VSKATKHHCAGTLQSQGERVGNVKRVSFEPGPEDRHHLLDGPMISSTT